VRGCTGAAATLPAAPRHRRRLGGRPATQSALAGPALAHRLLTLWCERQPRREGLLDEATSLWSRILCYLYLLLVDPWFLTGASCNSQGGPRRRSAGSSCTTPCRPPRSWPFARLGPPQGYSLVAPACDPAALSPASTPIPRRLSTHRLLGCQQASSVLVAPEPLCTPQGSPTAARRWRPACPILDP
jgi:hypothetical protein